MYLTKKNWLLYGRRQYRLLYLSVLKMCISCGLICYRELTPCVVREKYWNTKEDKGKSMMCVLYVLWSLDYPVIDYLNCEGDCSIRVFCLKCVFY